MRSVKKFGIRWSGLIPLCILTALVVIYFLFFFDQHLRYWMAKGATKLNGAKVDIASVTTHFSKARITIHGLDFGSRSEPMTNTASIDTVVLDINPGAIIHGHVVIDETSVTGMHYGTPRKTSAALSAAESKNSVPTLASKLGQAVEHEVKAAIEESPLNNLSALLNVDSLKQAALTQLDNLPTVQKVKQITEDVKNTEKAWRSQIEALPSVNDVRDIEQKIKSLASSEIKSPADVQRIIGEIQTLQKQAKTWQEAALQTQKRLVTDVQRFETMTRETAATVKNDVQGVMTAIKAPSLDIHDLAPALLGPMAQKRLHTLASAIDMARAYMPNNKNKEKNPDVVTVKRAQGTDVIFRREITYPKFLLRAAKVDTDLFHDEKRGRLTINAANITNTPHIWPEPATFAVDVKAPGIEHASLNGTIDHRTDLAHETIKAKVQGIDLGTMDLHRSNTLTFVITNALLDAETSVDIQDDVFGVHMAGTMRDVRYTVESGNAEITKILQDIVKDLNIVQLSVGVSGDIASPKFEIHSNLGERLAHGLRNALLHRFEELKTHVEAKVRERFEVEQARAVEAVNQLRQEGVDIATKRLSDLVGLDGMAQNAIKEVGGKLSKNAADAVFKQLGGKIKLPF